MRVWSLEMGRVFYGRQMGDGVCGSYKYGAYRERAKNTVRPEFYDFLFQKDFIVLSTVPSSLALGGRRNFLIIPKRAAICRLSLKTHI